MHQNRLSRESSPYLLQHQHNPVDWYPWGDEAFEAARRQNKPIFLSVGYSTCYWCHVMERESFENEDVAAVMNAHFINIKVDREERPDVDQLYMTAVQVLTHRGGWPMSVFLTTDLKPFYGGTYFPPTDRAGMPGFVTLLNGINDAWTNRRVDVDKAADQLHGILQQVAVPPKADESFIIESAFIGALLDRSTADYEPRFGGFGGAPKFPRQTLLQLLLDALAVAPSESRMSKLMHTLDAMAQGGIRDQLGGAFHRYSTDSRWLVPHFEIMLYDNALLASIYLQAAQLTGRTRHIDVARGILDFVLTDLTNADGAFYSAIDAESEAREGLSYLWTADEIASVLGADEAAIFNRVYGVDKGPNFADPHHGNGVADANVLYLPVAIEQTGADPSQLEAMRRKLLAHRRTRIQPITDTKIITSWNGLMIRAFAQAGRLLNEPRYIQAAERAADYLLAHHRTSTGALVRTSRDGSVRHDGFLEDYAYFIEALMELPADRYGQAVQELTAIMRSKFEDPQAGGFYFTEAGAPDMIVRQKAATDNPLPSGNAIAGLVLLRQGDHASAQRVLNAFSGQLRSSAEGMSGIVQLAQAYVQAHGPVAIVPTDGTVGIPTPAQRAAEVVTLAARWLSENEVELNVTIAPGFHINSNDADDGFVPTRLSVTPSPDAIRAPDPVHQEFTYADAPLAVYEGTVRFIVRFDVPLAAGHPVRLTLSYQPCDESACLAPATAQLETRRP